MWHISLFWNMVQIFNQQAKQIMDIIMIYSPKKDLGTIRNV